MRWGRFCRFLVFFLSMPFFFCDAHQYSTWPEKKSACCQSWSHYFMSGTAKIIKEALEVNTNIISINSAKIITGFIPLYLSARMIDDRVQKNFYDRRCHKNKHQVHHVIEEATEKGAFVIVISLSSLAILFPDENIRTVSRIYCLGAFSGLLLKRAIKLGRFQGNLRPWHEKFSKEKRAHGGFPSGHMFEATYTLTVWGLQYGWKAAIPLGLFTAAMFGVSVNCNRHYVSQVVAGAGLGVIYGAAAHTLINKELSSRFSLDLALNNKGNPYLQLGYSF